MERNFDFALKNFTNHIESLADTAPLLMAIIQAAAVGADEEFQEFMKKNSISTIDAGNNKVTINVSPELYPEFNELKKKKYNTSIANSILPSSFIVSLISQWDAFLGELIETIFYAKPELLNASQKEFTFAELIKFKDLEDAKKHIIEKEIESVLRKSHSEHFVWLENKLSMPLRKDLDIWPVFVEATERRNLFVHCNGVVSSQYLTVCKENDVKLPTNCKAGDSLYVKASYFREVYRCLFELGVKLAHVIWRKLKPEELIKADKNLNRICYDLILNKQYDLAITLLEFRINTLKKNASQDLQLYLTLNLAQAYKWNDNLAKMDTLLNSIDWSAFRDKFKLPKEVLSDNFNEACELMVKIGHNGDITKDEYKQWPLFKEFRKTAQFKDTFFQIFGEQFEVLETTQIEASGEKTCIPEFADQENKDSETALTGTASNKSNKRLKVSPGLAKKIKSITEIISRQTKPDDSKNKA